MRTKTEPSPIDRSIAADRSAGVAMTGDKKAEELPIDRDSLADRSAEVSKNAMRRQKECRSIADH